MRLALAVAVMAALLASLWLSGCSGAGSATGDNDTSNDNGDDTSNDNGDDTSNDNGGADATGFASVDDFAYQLQDVNPQTLGASAFDLVVMDYSRDGSEEGRYTAAEIAALKSSSGGDKLVLCYMSIGEAENYRWYWQNAWDAADDGTPDAGAPAWLGLSNPDWEGNYKVRYWDTAWWDVIFGSSDSYLDKIVAAGFDGVYLDIIDAFEYWGPEGDSGLERASAEREMVDFVKAIAQYARVTLGDTSFAVFPQNGEALAAHADYVSAVTGIGREDVWYNDNALQPAGDRDGVLEDLDVFREAGKLVLVIDYVTQARLIDAFYTQAQTRGYVPYATQRDLNVLTVNAGHAPD